MKMKTLNFNTNTFTKMTTNDRTKTIFFTHVTINIQSEQKATWKRSFQRGNYQQPKYYQKNYQQRNYQQPNYQRSQPLATNSDWRNPKQTVQSKNIPKTGRNPLDKNGIHTRCTIQPSKLGLRSRGKILPRYIFAV